MAGFELRWHVSDGNAPEEDAAMLGGVDEALAAAMPLKFGMSTSNLKC